VEHVAADNGFPELSVRAWPEHRGSSSDTSVAAAGGQRTEAGGVLQNGSSGQ
jgi:hypothetical protein